MKTLVVEDDPVSAAVLANILRAEGHQVTIAADGEIAWSLLDDPGRVFDVVFLDLALPKIDGFALWSRIRSSPLLRSLEIIFCTASSDRATVMKVLQLGARHYIVKPSTPEKVRAKLALLATDATTPGGRTAVHA
ncbi:MAG: response regulator [Verrucomicrobia bacterium]|nr:response regulator [Verrucomicrobiota bacterium]